MAKNKGGRPSLYSDELTDTICRRLVCGKDPQWPEPESLVSICRDDGMPDYSTVMDWLIRHPEFAEKYTRAKELQQQTREEEIIAIADNATDDIGFLVSDDAEGEGAKAFIKHSAIQRARLQIDTRKWVMGKNAPKKYGDKVQVGGDADNPVKIDTKVEVVHIHPK